jgi:hypothetical protein
VTGPPEARAGAELAAAAKLDSLRLGHDSRAWKRGKKGAAPWPSRETRTEGAAPAVGESAGTAQGGHSAGCRGRGLAKEILRALPEWMCSG